MIKKLIIVGFILAMAGVVTTIIGLQQVSYYTGIGALSAFTSETQFTFNYAVAILLEYWGIALLITSAILLFVAVFPFDNKLTWNRSTKAGLTVLVIVFLVGLSFTGVALYSVSPISHSPLKVKVTDSGSSFKSTTSVTVNYNASATGGWGGNSYSWNIQGTSFNDVSFNEKGSSSKTLTVTYDTSQMNPSNFFPADSKETFIVTVQVTDQEGNTASYNVTTQLSY